MVVGQAPTQSEGLVTISCTYISNLSAIRVTQVDACGVPIVGATSGYTSECAAGSITMAPVTDDTDDVIYKAPNGTLCAVKRGCRTLLGYDLTINLMQVSPELTEVLTGSPVVLDSAGTVVGNDTCSIQCRAGFALEAWAEIIEPTCTTGAAQYLYILLPWVTNGLLGDLEIGAEAVNVELTGSSRAGGGWGTGPYDVVSTTAPPVTTPGRLLTPLGSTCHRRIQLTPVPPPASSCVYTPVPALVP